jgi:hypothetical protein
MRGTGIDSEIEIYAMKQSNEYWYMELKQGGAIETETTASSICGVRPWLAILNLIEVWNIRYNISHYSSCYKGKTSLCLVRFVAKTENISFASYNLFLKGMTRNAVSYFCSIVQEHAPGLRTY